MVNFITSVFVVNVVCLEGKKCVTNLRDLCIPQTQRKSSRTTLPSIQHSDVWENAQGMGNSAGAQNQRAFVKKCQLSVNLS